MNNLALDIVHLLIKADAALHFDEIEDRFYPSGVVGRTLDWLVAEGDIKWNQQTDMVYLRNPSEAQRTYGAGGTI